MRLLEAPQVDARLRLVEDGQLGAAGQHHGDLDALELAAGQAVVHLPVDIVPGAQTDLAQIARRPRCTLVFLPAARLEQVLAPVSPLKRTGCWKA